MVTLLHDRLRLTDHLIVVRANRLAMDALGDATLTSWIHDDFPVTWVVRGEVEEAVVMRFSRHSTQTSRLRPSACICGRTEKCSGRSWRAERSPRPLPDEDFGVPTGEISAGMKKPSRCRS